MKSSKLHNPHDTFIEDYKILKNAIDVSFKCYRPNHALRHMAKLLDAAAQRIVELGAQIKK